MRRLDDRSAAPDRMPVGTIHRKLAAAYRAIGSLHLELARAFEEEGCSEPERPKNQTETSPAAVDVSFPEPTSEAVRRVLRKAGFEAKR
jgi:hypothetical protein